MEPESRLLEIVERLYAAAVGEEDWDGPLSTLADYCAAESAALVRVDQSNERSSVVAPRADPDIIAAYNAQWWVHDPTIRATHKAPVGEITSLEDTGRKLFRRSAFHNEFWYRSGLGAERLAVNLNLSGSGFASCVVHAPAKRDVFEHESETRFALLVPHLIRAVRIQERLQRLSMENAVSTLPGNLPRRGLILVDGACGVLSADEPGEALLTDGSGLHFRRGILAFRDLRVHRLVRRAVAACAGHEPPPPFRSITWNRGDGLRPLVVEVLPWSSALSSLDLPGTRAVALLVFQESPTTLVSPERQERSNTRRQTVEPAAHSQTRAELFSAIARDIVANLGDCDITLSWLARRHGVTPRRIRDLFYAKNTSFTTYLLNARLDRAREMLTDPAFADKNVATIALDSGFGDISWFHHTFRRRFKMTPGEARKYWNARR